MPETVPIAAIRSKLAAIHEALIIASGQQLGDHFEFEIPPPRDLLAAPGGGGVFPVIAKLAGRDFARFHIDVGFGDGSVGPTETLVGENVMEFAGLPPATVKAIGKPQQFAEKIHAYSYPWSDRVNTRSRDLVDLVLLIERGDLDARTVRQALRLTFENRGRREVPTRLPPPPEQWRSEFGAMAAEAGISALDIDAAFTVLEEYWAGVVAGD